jgi:hypothetical protein
MWGERRRLFGAKSAEGSHPQGPVDTTRALRKAAQGFEC